MEGKQESFPGEGHLVNTSAWDLRAALPCFDKNLKGHRSDSRRVLPPGTTYRPCVQNLGPGPGEIQPGRSTPALFPGDSSGSRGSENTHREMLLAWHWTSFVCVPFPWLLYLKPSPSGLNSFCEWGLQGSGVAGGNHCARAIKQECSRPDGSTVKVFK